MQWLTVGFTVALVEDWKEKRTCVMCVPKKGDLIMCRQSAPQTNVDRRKICVFAGGDNRSKPAPVVPFTFTRDDQQPPASAAAGTLWPLGENPSAGPCFLLL